MGVRMTISTNHDEPISRAIARGEIEYAIRERSAHLHNLTTTLPRIVALVATPGAETGQLYPDEDGPRDA
jgi:hypothetical protein